MYVTANIALLLLTASAFAQEPGRIDLTAAQRELDSMFDRPAGQRISAEQKERLAGFVARHKGSDLEHLGYATALHLFLGGDPMAAALELDRFFARFPAIANEEHRMMAGRIYLGSVARSAREPDAAGEALRRAERAGLLYPDAALLVRVIGGLASQQEEAEATRLRLALARGILSGSASDAEKVAAVQELFGNAAPAGSQGSNRAAARADPAASPAEATARIGERLPAIPVEHSLNAPAGFDPASLSGKVVVLDFFATWCPPCRTAIPELKSLREELGDGVQLVGITRLYGRGMDFGAGAELPHGGQSVGNLTRDEEFAINARFNGAFGVDYPVLFTDADTARQRFGVTGIPTVFVIDKDGRVAGRVVGSDEKQQKELRRLVEAALK